MTMGTQQKWMGMIVILATLLLGSAGPGYAWRGGWHGGHGGEALGWVSASASGHTGGRIGGHTGAWPMPTPMATRPSSPCHPPKSMCNPRHRLPPSLLHQPLGITVTTHGGITPTCSNVQGDGGQSPPRRHKPEAAGPRGHHLFAVILRPEMRQEVSLELGTPLLGVDCGAAWGV